MGKAMCYQKSFIVMFLQENKSRAYFPSAPDLSSLCFLAILRMQGIDSYSRTVPYIQSEMGTLVIPVSLLYQYILQAGCCCKLQGLQLSDYGNHFSPLEECKVHSITMNASQQAGMKLPVEHQINFSKSDDISKWCQVVENN